MCNILHVVAKLTKLNFTGAAINLVDKFETCALVFAARSGHLNVISHLVSCDWPQNTGANTAAGHAGLINDLGLAEAAQQAAVAAAEAGHEQPLEFLLDMAEVDANAADSLAGNTALCAAAGAGQRRCVEILLRRGAKVSLFFKASFDRSKIKDELSLQHFKVGVANLKDTAPVHAAIAGGYWDCTEVFPVQS